MTTAQMIAIAEPATGLQVYNTTEKSITLYNGSSWNSPSNFNKLLLAYRALGSTIKAEPAIGLSTGTANGAMSNQRLYFTAIWVEKEIIVTGATWYQGASGVFAASVYNGVALYSYSAGTMTLIDSSTRDDNIWKSPADTWPQKAFAGGARTLQPGLYFAAAVYNASSITTNPVIAFLNNATSVFSSLLTTNSGKIFGTINAITTLPTTQTHTALSILGNIALCLY